MFKRRKTADIELLNAGFRYALSLAANTQDAEDLVHDAWIRLNRRYGQLTEKPVLFRTIRNLYIDQYRRRQVVHFVDDCALQNEADKDGSANVSSVEIGYIAAEELQMALEKLRDVEREYLFLAVVEGYTADEIGQMAGVARGTVLSILHRSKLKLRRILAQQSSDGGGVSTTGHDPAEKGASQSDPPLPCQERNVVDNDLNVVDIGVARVR